MVLCMQGGVLGARVRVVCSDTKPTKPRTININLARVISRTHVCGIGAYHPLVTTPRYLCNPHSLERILRVISSLEFGIRDDLRVGIDFDFEFMGMGTICVKGIKRRRE